MAKYVPIQDCRTKCGNLTCDKQLALEFFALIVIIFNNIAANNSVFTRPRRFTKIPNILSGSKSILLVLKKTLGCLFRSETQFSNQASNHNSSNNENIRKIARPITAPWTHRTIYDFNIILWYIIVTTGWGEPDISREEK